MRTPDSEPLHWHKQRKLLKGSHVLNLCWTTAHWGFMCSVVMNPVWSCLAQLYLWSAFQCIAPELLDRSSQGMLARLHAPTHLLRTVISMVFKRAWCLCTCIHKHMHKCLVCSIAQIESGWSHIQLRHFGQLFCCRLEQANTSLNLPELLNEEEVHVAVQLYPADEFTVHMTVNCSPKK